MVDEVLHGLIIIRTTPRHMSRYLIFGTEKGPVHAPSSRGSSLVGPGHNFDAGSGSGARLRSAGESAGQICGVQVQAEPVQDRLF